MSSSYLLQRRREERLRRFGLALGGALALLFHLALFWGPKVDYRPVLEEARVRRVLVARPYVPAPPPPKPPPAQKSTAPARPKPAPKTVEPPAAPAAVPQRAPEPAPQPPAAKIPETMPDAPQATPKTDQDAWSNLLASLEGKKKDIDEKWQGRRAEIEAQAKAVNPGETQWGEGSEGDEGGGDGYLDSRVRMTVVSYPPTSIETDYPRIPYPDLRFRRAQLETGTCRVYYRVKTDDRGEIKSTEFKTPATEGEREHYAEFVAQVVQSVAEWPFPRQEADVFIDVLFQIE